MSVRRERGDTRVIGAIAGDIIGSLYEQRRIKEKSFPLFDDRATFTDDTVLTVATAAAIVEGRTRSGAGADVPTIAEYARVYKEYGRRYPDCGWGSRFAAWIASDDNSPYNSYGNGSAMRVSPVAWAFSREEDVLEHAHRTAMVSHNHPEGIKGAQAAALAVFLARRARLGTWPDEKEPGAWNDLHRAPYGVERSPLVGSHADRAVRFAMAREIEARFGYDLGQLVSDIRYSYEYDETCQGSVPEAIVCFLDSISYEDAIRNAVSLGGDSDTLASIAGAIAGAYYGVPHQIVGYVNSRLPEELRGVLSAFDRLDPI